MPGTLLQIGAVVLFLGGLIFVHELGHFLVAKALGVKVLRFSIGFGPRAFGFRRGETEYWIAVFPLGGYVKMAGDLGDDPEHLPPEDRGRGFLEQSPSRRLAISIAGPAANLVFPALVYFALAVAQNGQPTPGPFVGKVVPGSPAAVAGLRPGDRILSVAVPGEPVHPIRRFGDLRAAVAPHPEELLTFRVQRDGKEIAPLTIAPALDIDRNPIETTRRGVLGVSATYAPAIVAPARPGAAGPLEPLVQVRLGLADGREVLLAPAKEKYVDELTREERTRWVLGFHPERRRLVDAAALVVEEIPMQRGVVEMAAFAWEQLQMVVRLNVLGIVKIFTGQISFKTVGGPLMLFSIASEAAEEGLSSFLFQMAIISVNLALMNLLPIPVLDGE